MEICPLSVASLGEEMKGNLSNRELRQQKINALLFSSFLSKIENKSLHKQYIHIIFVQTFMN